MTANEYINESAFENGSNDITFNEQKNNLVVTRTTAKNAIALAHEEIRIEYGTKIREYELRYKHIEETLEAIVHDCSMLTSGNVSHNSRCIQGLAQRRLDYIRKHKNGNT